MPPYRSSIFLTRVDKLALMPAQACRFDFALVIAPTMSAWYVWFVLATTVLMLPRVWLDVAAAYASFGATADTDERASNDSQVAISSNDEECAETLDELERRLTEIFGEVR